jgi:hypothetical protein
VDAGADELKEGDGRHGCNCSWYPSSAGHAPLQTAPRVGFRGLDRLPGRRGRRTDRSGGGRRRNDGRSMHVSGGWARRCVSDAPRRTPGRTVRGTGRPPPLRDARRIGRPRSRAVVLLHRGRSAATPRHRPSSDDRGRLGRRVGRLPLVPRSVARRSTSSRLARTAPSPSSVPDSRMSCGRVCTIGGVS